MYWKNLLILVLTQPLLSVQQSKNCTTAQDLLKVFCFCCFQKAAKHRISQYNLEIGTAIRYGTVYTNSIELRNNKFRNG